MRKLRIAGIFQHYYPEGGWGYVIILSALLVQILAHGVQMSMGMVMVHILTRRQTPSQVTVTQAGRAPLFFRRWWQNLYSKKLLNVFSIP